MGEEHSGGARGQQEAWKPALTASIPPGTLCSLRGHAALSNMAIQLKELAARLGATVHGNGNPLVTGCAPIETAGPDEITFLANRRYLPFLKTTRAAGVLIDADTPCPSGLTRLVCDDPYFAFRNALVEFHGFRPHPRPMDEVRGETSHASAACHVSARAAIHPSASIGEGAIVHPFAVVEHDARIGARTVLYPGVHIGPHAVTGDDCLLYPNVVVYDHCVLGDRVTVHAGSVIGHDGFGYATHAGRHEKIPQTGPVVASAPGRSSRTSSRSATGRASGPTASSSRSSVFQGPWW
jgi:UDP-3-O-[3-hydroxymyristoyl] glucosamine N-acyltransferase